MRDSLYRAQLSKGRRIPKFVEEIFTKEYPREIFYTKTRHLIGQEFERIYNESRGFRFPLTHIDPKQLWQKLYSTSLGLSNDCVLIDDISGLLELLDQSHRGDHPCFRKEAVLVVTPFAVKRLKWLTSRTTLLQNEDKRQLEAYSLFMKLPDRKLLVIHSPMVTSDNGSFVTGQFENVDGKRVLRHYTTASQAVLNAEQHTQFTVPTMLTPSNKFPQNVPFTVRNIPEKDVKIIGLQKQSGDREKKRVLLGRTKERGWVELTSTPTHTNAEFGDCIIVLLSALVPGSTCLAKDSGIVQNLSMFSECVGPVTETDVQLSTVELKTPKNLFFRDLGRTDDCALDWLKRMIRLYIEHRVYSDELHEINSVVYATARKDALETLETVLTVYVNVKQDPKDLHEPFQKFPYSVQIYSNATHYVCTIITTGINVTSNRFFSIASFLASIGDTQKRVELNQSGAIHDFIYQVSLLYYLTAQQTNINTNDIDSEHRISMQLLKMDDRGLSVPTPRTSMLREEKIPTEGFGVGEGAYEDDETVDKAWTQALKAVAQKNGWIQSTPEHTGKRKRRQTDHYRRAEVVRR